MWDLKDRKKRLSPLECFYHKTPLTKGHRSPWTLYHIPGDISLTRLILGIFPSSFIEVDSLSTLSAESITYPRPPWCVGTSDSMAHDNPWQTVLTDRFHRIRLHIPRSNARGSPTCTVAIPISPYARCTANFGLKRVTPGIPDLFTEYPGL